MNQIGAMQFGEFRLISARGPMYCGSKEILLRPKSMEVLWYLASHADKTISKQTLFAAAWPGLVVSNGVLAVCIREIRKVLSDNSHDPQYIQTMHGRGYRFIAPLSQSEPESHLFPTMLTFGREHELQQLLHHYAQACSGQRQIVFIGGEAGIGKTTLIAAFEKELYNEQRTRLVHGQCIEHSGSGEAYLPLLEALSELSQGLDSEAIIATLHHYAPNWLIQLPALLSDNEREKMQQQHDVNTQRMQRELVDLLEALSTDHPLVLVLEDLNWSDSYTVEVLSLLTRRQHPARLLVIASYRTVELIVHQHPLNMVRQELKVLEQCREIVLGFLDETSLATYLEQRFTGQISADAITEIYQRTQGHPLFMVAMADYLAEHQASAGTLDIAVALLNKPLPTSLRDFIELQIGRLSEAEQQVLEAAGIAGMTFSSEILATALGTTQIAVDEHCETLCRRGQFITDAGLAKWPDDTISGRYAFTHALYPEVLCHRIGSARQVRYHRLIGERLERGFAEQTHPVATTLAWHFELGHDPQRAVLYLQQAAEIALTLYANTKAAEHLHRALTLLESQPATPERDYSELELQLALGPVLMTLQGYAAPAVKAAFDRAQVLCQVLGQTSEQFPILRGLASFYSMQADYRTAHKIARQLLDFAENADSPNPGFYLEAHLMLGNVYYFTGDFVAAHDHLQKGIGLYNREQHHSHALYYGIDPGVLGLIIDTLTLWSLGYSQQGLSKAYQALALAKDLNHPYSLTQCTNIVAFLHLLRREPAQILEHALATQTLAKEYGFTYLSSGAICYQGWALAEQGQTEEGVAHIREGLQIYQETGATGALTTLQAMLAEAYTLNHQVDEGLSVVAEALIMANATEERFCEAELLRLKSLLLLQQSEPDAIIEAESCLQQSLKIARSQQAKTWELRSATNLARLWDSQGKTEQAHALLAPVCAWFSEGFETNDLRDAKALLTRLSTPPLL